MWSRALDEVRWTGVWPESYMARPKDVHRSKFASVPRELPRESTLRHEQSHIDTTTQSSKAEEDLQQAAAILAAMGRIEVSPDKESNYPLFLHPSKEDEDNLDSFQGSNE